MATASARMSHRPDTVEIPEELISLRNELVPAVRALLLRGLKVARDDQSYERRLPVAIAAAHVGLAALKTKPDELHIRRFAFAHAIRHLAELASSERTSHLIRGAETADALAAACFRGFDSQSFRGSS